MGIQAAQTGFSCFFLLFFFVLLFFKKGGGVSRSRRSYVEVSRCMIKTYCIPEENVKELIKKIFYFKKNFPETIKLLLRQGVGRGPFSLGHSGQVKFYVFETFK